MLQRHRRFRDCRCQIRYSDCEDIETPGDAWFVHQRAGVSQGPESDRPRSSWRDYEFEAASRSGRAVRARIAAVTAETTCAFEVSAITT
jgi:hypothetical protein